MPAWIVHAPYSHTDGRDYRPGDTLIADDRPDCDCTPVGGEEIAGRDGQIQAGDVEFAAPRRGRKAKA